MLSPVMRFTVSARPISKETIVVFAIIIGMWMLFYWISDWRYIAICATVTLLSILWHVLLRSQDS
jgi:hypothetical protein